MIDAPTVVAMLVIGVAGGVLGGLLYEWVETAERRRRARRETRLLDEEEWLARQRDREDEGDPW